MQVKTPVPTFYKGDLVKPHGICRAWRRINPEEQRAWYDRLYEDCRADRDVPYDDAGESKLAPSDTYYTLNPEMVLTVVRGKARAPLGYGSVKDCCLVFCPDNGEALYVERHELTDRW